MSDNGSALHWLTDPERALLSDHELKIFMPRHPRMFYKVDIYLKTVEDRVDWMELLRPFICGEGWIPVEYQYNGASVGILRPVFPKWKHPRATARHDYRCEIAERFKKTHPELYRKLRKFADVEFKNDVRIGGNAWEIHAGYLAVRLGSIF